MKRSDVSTGPVTVSIITPCYNGGRFLRQTLQSAVSQSRPALEVIVIDDGSTDDSAAIASSFGPPVRVLQQTNQGESVARNRGLREARGTHILFLDADDLLDVHALEHLAGALDGHPDAVGLMGCGWFTESPDAPHTSKALTFQHFYPDIIQSNFGPPLCWLAPREAVLKAGGFAEEMRWFEDWDLWWRVGLEEPRLISVPYIGARYRQHAASQLATTSPENRARGHAALTGRMANAILERPGLLAAHGEPLFWAVWTALVRAREQKIGWVELAPLTAALKGIATSGPPSVTTSRSARLIRLIGVRGTLALQRA
jgi:hypothetical protein